VSPAHAPLGAPASPRRRIPRLEGSINPRAALRFIYLGRFSLVSGLLLGALIAWGSAQPEQTFLATLLFLTGLASGALGFWWTEVLERDPGRSYLVGQVALDALLVTGVVHLTGGGESPFAWVYILVISEGAILVPLSGGLLLAALASILYFADIVWGHSETLSFAVALQLGLFMLVAGATGFLGDRLRRTGVRLGRMESELRRLQLDTGEILATIRTGVITVDEGGHLLYVNPAARGLLGWGPRDFEDEPVLEPLGQALPRLREVMEQSLSSRSPLPGVRIEIPDPAGEPRILGVSTFLREEPGDPLAVTAIVEDRTDLERIEVLNRRGDRLRAVADLSAALAHEIKNPLASIRSAVEQFSSPRLGEGDRSALTRMVVRESDRLSRLLGDFLDFSRGRIECLEPLALDELVLNAAAVIREHPSTRERRVEVAVELVPCRVRADADLVSRGVLNLLLNAVQFSPEGGRVEVTLDRPSEVPPEVEFPGALRLVVRDHGPGVPEALRERIFDPFLTTREGGTGLGLAVVHSMVQAHGGVILLSLPPGGGAEFTLFLPPLEAEPASP
jgi:two-component system, NtrC family, sensor histidine kinase PilS